jgi:hypothetical protein
VFFVKEREYRKVRNVLQALKYAKEITQEVLESSFDILNRLVELEIPAPRVFAHNPKSMVFHWTLGERSIYATVSNKKVGVLISSPSNIEFRTSLSIDEEPVAA